MGILNRIFGKRESSAKKDANTKLAMVLLSRPQVPSADSVVTAFREFAAAGESLRADSDGGEQGASDHIISLAFNTGESAFVALMPVAVPYGEADQGAQFSLSRFKHDWELPPHNAHLLVTFSASRDLPPIVCLSRFTSLLAAVTKVSPAVGVYWGNAGATHDADFFVSVASDHDVAPRMMLWSGLSIARQNDGKLSLLSLGMEQLNLPDLLLIAGERSRSDAITTLYELLAYVAERGKPLPEGDTVGPTYEERYPVHYVTSPVDPKKRVWRVELP